MKNIEEIKQNIRALFEQDPEKLEELRSFIEDIEDINYIEPEPDVIDNINLFDDFYILGKNIIEFIKNNPDCEIHPADNPMKLRLGWVDFNSGKLWEIKISDARLSLHNNTKWSSSDKDILKQTLQTVDGKKNLIAAWMSAAKK